MRSRPAHPHCAEKLTCYFPPRMIGLALKMLFGDTAKYLMLVAGLFIFGIGVQGAKIAVDTIVQSDTADAYRGRAFSLYDVLFNVAECVAAGVAILVVPDTGWSRPVQVALVLFVWCVALGYNHLVGRLGDQPREVSDGAGTYRTAAARRREKRPPCDSPHPLALHPNSSGLRI